MPAAQPPVWTIVWAVGAAVCAVVFAVAYGRCCREFRTSFPVENDVTRRWLQSHPLRRTIAIRRSGRISSPLTFGVMPGHPDAEEDGLDGRDGAAVRAGA